MANKEIIIQEFYLLTENPNTDKITNVQKEIPAILKK